MTKCATFIHVILSIIKFVLEEGGGLANREVLCKLTNLQEVDFNFTKFENSVFLIRIFSKFSEREQKIASINVDYIGDLEV